MNAPAKIAPARDRYIPIVKHHLPAAEGEDLRMRCSILLLRDQATSRLRDCGEDAADALRTIERLATLNAYRPMPREELKRLQYCLVRLTAVASDLNVFTFRLAHPQPRQDTDARGR